MTTVKLADGRTCRLGRIRPKARPPALKLAAYFDPQQMAAPPPPSVDYAAKAMSALKRMYGNDKWGDCVLASKAHQVGVWTGNDGPSPAEVSDRDVLADYHAICGPGDNGCVITDVLDVMRSKGLWGHKIDGYVAVDWGNPLEVRVALLVFGTLTLGVNLPAAWLDAPEGGTWDTTDTQIVGGHDVAACGYDASGVKVATWGGLRTITWPAFVSHTWLEECYAQFSPDWYGSDKLAPCGIDAATLAADLDKLGKGVLPDIGPTPPVPPTPPPTPGPTAEVVIAAVNRAIDDYALRFARPTASKLKGVEAPVAAAVRRAFGA